MYYRLLCALPRQPEGVGQAPLPLDEVVALVTDELDPGGVRIVEAILEEGALEPETEAWLAWFDRLEAVARAERCPWLARFVDFERSLREAVASLRGHAAPTDPRRHRGLLASLAEVDPLEVERRLDEARLAELRASPTDGFHRDAVLAYLAAALVLERWTVPEGDPSELLEVST